jgi:hypothetical protein
MDGAPQDGTWVMALAEGPGGPPCWKRVRWWPQLGGHWFDTGGARYPLERLTSWRPIQPETT